MYVVVRCPGCRGVSRVGPEAVGLLVACPRCGEPFLAAEEAVPVSAPAPRPEPAPVDPDRRQSAPRNRNRVEPVAPADGVPADRPMAQPVAPGGLPVSVLIGLALLPFVIPLLWLIAPLAVGQPPALSLAAPVSLAVAASALCLAVVYTVDWSPATRVKGVLMLVGLAYFAGLNLYFLQKEAVDRVRRVFGPDRREFRSPHGEFRVRMPGRPQPLQESPLPGWELRCYRAIEPTFPADLVFVVGSGKDPLPRLDGEAWADEVDRAIQKAGGGVPIQRAQPVVDPHPAWEWQVQLPDNGTIRTVRVYRVDGRVYYLSAEGPNLTPEDELAHDFFESFVIVPKQG